MPSASDHIRLVYAAAETGAPLPRITAQWLADAFRIVEKNRRLRLEAALGLTARGGVGSLSMRERYGHRNALLRETRRRFYPASTHQPLEAARAILTVHDKRKGQTGDPASDAEEMIDALLAIGLPIPEEKQLGRILGT